MYWLKSHRTIFLRFSDYVCIGKQLTVNGFPYQDDPEDPYCRKLISCTNIGPEGSKCPVEQYYNISSRECQTSFPTTQQCRRGKRQ